MIYRLNLRSNYPNSESMLIDFEAVDDEDAKTVAKRFVFGKSHSRYSAVRLTCFDKSVGARYIAGYVAESADPRLRREVES